MKKGGQGWGFDLIIALSIFVAGIVFFYFYTINLPGQEEEKSKELRAEANFFADTLLSEGFPENWNLTNVAKIGILSGEKVNKTKLEYFYNSSIENYVNTQILFGIRNNYYVSFQGGLNINGQEISYIGMNSSNIKSLEKVSRIVIYEDDFETVDIHVWD